MIGFGNYALLVLEWECCLFDALIWRKASTISLEMPVLHFHGANTGCNTHENVKLPWQGHCLHIVKV